MASNRPRQFGMVGPGRMGVEQLSAMQDKFSEHAEKRG
jgi:hypothetical protein